MATLLERLNSSDKFAQSIGAQLTDVREGYACAELIVKECHLNAAGVCQGGVMYTLADLAFAAVANCHGILSLGISNTITFVKSAQLGDHLYAECVEVVNHYKLPYCDIKVKNQNDEVLAVVTGLAYRSKKDYEFDSFM